MLKYFCVMLLGSALVFGGQQQEEGKSQTSDSVKLEGVKCFMMPAKKASEKNAVEYKDGNVYFCCQMCAKKFSGDKDKYATKANHQLVLTGQYKQTACPISGETVDDSQTVEIGGVKVAFCCENCKAKAAGAEGDAQVEMVFGNETFEKCFAAAGDSLAKATCPLSGGEVSKEHFVEFNGGKVYFCCGDCAKAFSADNAEHVAKANHQLVVTGQYVQKACPMSGGKVNAEQSVEVVGTTVGFCCGNCKGKAAGAADDTARITMLFNKDAFGKGFEKKN